MYLLRLDGVCVFAIVCVRPVCVCVCGGPYPKVGGGEAVAGSHVGGGGGVSVEGVDVGQQGAHDSRDA